jgi:hypothetical protein
VANITQPENITYIYKMDYKNGMYVPQIASTKAAFQSPLESDGSMLKIITIRIQKPQVLR